jgi:hypothetical protein
MILRSILPTAPAHPIKIFQNKSVYSNIVRQLSLAQRRDRLRDHLFGVAENHHGFGKVK